MPNRVTPEAIEINSHFLKNMIQPGAKVYTFVRHISRTGRKYVDFYIIYENQLVRITHAVSVITGCTYDDRREAIAAQDIGEVIEHFGWKLFANNDPKSNYRLSLERM